MNELPTGSNNNLYDPRPYCMYLGSHVLAHLQRTLREYVVAENFARPANKQIRLFNED